MAIQFIQDISQTRTLPAFNNQEVSFKSTSSGIPIRAVIKAGSISVDVTPDANGVFHFNFKEVFKILVNRNHFQDPLHFNVVAPPAGTYQLRITDPASFRNTLVDYQIEMEDGELHQAARQYKIFRSVTTLINYRQGLIANGSITILSPMTAKSNRTFYATIFDGYPFDFAILSESFQQVTIRNKTTGFQTSVSLVMGINRIILSNGISNVTLEDILPIADGLNEIEVVTSLAGSSGPERVTLFLTQKKPCKNGILLKWLNDFGGWNYYFFQKNAEKLDFRETGDFPNNYGNLDKKTNSFTSLGYEKEKSIQVYADQLSRIEKRYINTIFGSPKVYMYLKDSFQRSAGNAYIDVRVSGSKTDLESRYLRYYDFLFDISIPYQTNMTM